MAPPNIFSSSRSLRQQYTSGTQIQQRQTSRQQYSTSNSERNTRTPLADQKGCPPSLDMNRASQIINAGEMTVVRLEKAEYSTTDDVCGTVELSNYRNKEITSVILEISTWRHISIDSKTKGAAKLSSVEQVSLAM